MVSVVPFAANAAETKTGGVVSTVELFVTARAVNEIASFPTVSWIALLEFAVLGVGAEYATVTT